MPYQSIEYTHSEQSDNTRPIEGFLNLLHDHSNKNHNGLIVVSTNLVKQEWTQRYYTRRSWHILIWSVHHYTDDEILPMLRTEEDEI